MYWILRDQWVQQQPSLRPTSSVRHCISTKSSDEAEREHEQELTLPFADSFVPNVSVNTRSTLVLTSKGLAHRKLVAFKSAMTVLNADQPERALSVV